MSDRILVAVAWPYANGPLHLGHIAGSLLPPDIFARYHRMKGSEVAMVSGSDMHGTPITVAAEKDGVPPEMFARVNNDGHAASLKALGIQFDLFTSTATENHARVVHDVFTTLREQGYIEKRTMTSPYDPQAKKFLPDRYVEGTCPHCASPEARGDQCDACGRTLDPQELIEPRSKLSGAAPEYRETDHFFLKLTAFEDRLKQWVGSHTHWRANTQRFTQNWLEEGLQDRPITRDMTYGVTIPLEGYDDKRIYVWFEAVIGYLSATMEWAARQGRPDAWQDFWLQSKTRSYYFLGKDNIPFHTIIWPAMLMGYAEGKNLPYNLPYDVPANEFMNFQGTKFSKSRGNLITVDEALSAFQADAVRYYLGANMPERGDANWAWDDFVSKVNDELVGTYGNLANRIVAFTRKHHTTVPAVDAPLSPRDEVLLARIQGTYDATTAWLEKVELKKALKEVMALAAEGNRYIDEKAPWKQAKQGQSAELATTLHVGLRLLRSLAILTQPFLPFSAQTLWRNLGEEGDVAQVAWSAALDGIRAGQDLPEPQVLFRKIDPATILPIEASPAARATAAKTTPPAPAATKEKPAVTTQPDDAPTQITIDEFAKVQMRVGRVLSVEDHPKADKLYVLKVDIGEAEPRQIVAGLKAYLKPDELLGKLVTIVANLKPAKLRGVESQGMILAAELGDVVAPLTPTKETGVGATIR